MKLLLISPHLDDAVLSAGQLLAGNPGSTVLTVFAGIPRDTLPLTPYDEKMGFLSSQMAMQARRTEDGHALKVLGADHIWLNYLDGQYGNNIGEKEVALEIVKQTDEGNYDAIVGPLGIEHSDHLQTRRIVGYMAHVVNRPFYLWADLPYRMIYPGSAWELAKGLKSERPGNSKVGSGDLKLEACKQYRSQWDKYDIVPEKIMINEQFWRLK